MPYCFGSKSGALMSMQRSFPSRSFARYISISLAQTEQEPSKKTRSGNSGDGGLRLFLGTVMKELSSRLPGWFLCNDFQSNELDSGIFHANFRCGGSRHVDYTTRRQWSSVVDTHFNRFMIANVDNTYFGTKRK